MDAESKIAHQQSSVMMSGRARERRPRNDGGDVDAAEACCGVPFVWERLFSAAMKANTARYVAHSDLRLTQTDSLMCYLTRAAATTT